MSDPQRCGALFGRGRMIVVGLVLIRSRSCSQAPLEL